MTRRFTWTWTILAPAALCWAVGGCEAPYTTLDLAPSELTEVAGQGGAPVVGGDSGTDAPSSATGGVAGASTLPCSPACEGDTPVCDQSVGSCVECLADSDCDGERCLTTSNECVDCLDDGDCEGADVCDLLTLRCAQPCTSSSVCEGDFPVCHPERRLCVQCSTDADCSGEVCSPAIGRCAECVTDLDCSEPGQTCDVAHGECTGP